MKKLYVAPWTWFFESFDSFVYTVLCWNCNNNVDLCKDRYVCPLWKIRFNKNYRMRFFRPHIVNDYS